MPTTTKFKIIFSVKHDPNSGQTGSDNSRIADITYIGIGFEKPTEVKKSVNALENVVTKEAYILLKQYLNQRHIISEVGGLRSLCRSDITFQNSANADLRPKLLIVESKTDIQLTYSHELTFIDLADLSSEENPKTISYSATFSMGFNAAEAAFIFPDQRSIQYQLTGQKVDIEKFKAAVIKGVSEAANIKAFGKMQIDTTSSAQNGSSFFGSFSLRNLLTPSKTPNSTPSKVI